MLRVLAKQSTLVDNPSARSSRRRLPHVQEERADGLPVAHHDLLGAQLPGRVQQQSGHTQVREQRDEHSPVQLLATSLLAAQLHGRVHLVVAFRRREGHRDARLHSQYLLRARAHRRRRHRRFISILSFLISIYLYTQFLEFHFINNL